MNLDVPPKCLVQTSIVNYVIVHAHRLRRFGDTDPPPELFEAVHRAVHRRHPLITVVSG